MAEKKRIFITCKTYPQPSVRHKETVCTGGMLESGQLIRLYPINFRGLPYDSQFKKYQWIEMAIEKNTKDPRAESYRVDRNTKIKTVGNVIVDWPTRLRLILPQNMTTMCRLNAGDGIERSLGVIRPRLISDVVIKPAEDQWSQKYLDLMKQDDLFEGRSRPLAKIPFAFKVKFNCEEAGCKGHMITDIDWEVYELYRKTLQGSVSRDDAAAKVRDRLMNRVFAPDRDPLFFVGNMLKHPRSWLIVGIAWPKKGVLAQTSLNI